MQHKTTLIILLLFLISIGVDAQSKQISLTAKNTPIKEVLTEIQQKSGYRILYNDEVVPDALRVSVNAENVAVKDLLNLMLQNTELTFVAQPDDLIVITRKEFTASANQITGMVVDETGEPVPFANVVQLALPDSAFINGASTGVNGRFSLERNNNNPVLLEITFLGYKRHQAEITDNNLGTIRLTPETTLLGEVVVTASRPTHKMEADGMVTSVQNTLLARLGTANDVLAQLPFVTGEDGSYTVFGRGAPLIYINNRLMRDNNELRQLNSGDIKDVKVILTPGSQYDASVGSVIRITTVKPVGEGLSGTLYAQIRQNRKLFHYESANFNYRKGELDVFGNMSFYRTRPKQNQQDEKILYSDKAYHTKNNNVQEFENQIWKTTAGVNYTFSPTHSIGLRYNYDWLPSRDFKKYGTTEHFVNDINDASILDADKRKTTGFQHYANLYYYKQFANETNIRFESDYVKSGNTNKQVSETENVLSQQKTLVESQSNAQSMLYAGKLLAETPLSEGKITLGSEVVYTENRQEYKMLNEDIAVNLPSNFNNSKQNLFAAFLSYDYTWQRFSFNAGMRYEHIDFDYFLNGVLSYKQSRVYDNLFPSFSVAYLTDDIQLSLSHHTIVYRPNYFTLRSSIAYNNAYTYEGGNPSLQPMYIQKLTFLFGWKNVHAEVSYNWIKDNMLFVAQQFNDTNITLFTMINLPRSQRFDANVSYAPKIGSWQPTFEAGIRKQNLAYKDKTYNKPYFSYGWNNIIQLPYEWMLAVNMQGNSQGERGVLHIYSAFKTDIRINKRLLDNKLSLTIGATDIFATNSERWHIDMGNVYTYKWNDNDSRGVYLQATYTFNSTRNKYKGEGAANEERNRL